MGKLKLNKNMGLVQDCSLGSRWSGVLQLKLLVLEPIGPIPVHASKSIIKWGNASRAK